MQLALCRHFDAQEAISANGMGMGQIVAIGNFKNPFERAISDFHDQEGACGVAPIVLPLAADGQTVAFGQELEVLAADAR
jgi:hypothetical protein